ncbi:MAG: AtpZ/AtpI family protein [Anaeromyxobacter sp.]
MAGPDGQDRRNEEEGLSSLASGYQKAAPYISASWSLVASVGVFAGAGYWLDQKVGNRTPWFFIVGAVVGMIGGFISFFRVVLGMNKAGKGAPVEKQDGDRR